MSPRYERPHLPVDELYPSTFNSASSRSVELIRWETFVTDPRLIALIQIGLSNNRDVKIAILNVEHSREQYHITSAASYPGVSANGSVTRSHMLRVTSNQWSANLGSVAYELDFFGRVHSMNHEALEKFYSTIEAKRIAHSTLVSELAKAYWNLSLNEAQVHVAQRNLSSIRDTFQVIQSTFDAGASSELDLRTAEGQVHAAQLEEMTVERQRAQALDALVLLLGQSLPSSLPVGKSLDDLSILLGISPGIPSSLLENRPDILQAEHQLKAANANIGVARAAFFPSISLTGSVGSSSSELSKLFGSGTGIWSFAPQVTLPLFSGGQNRANLHVSSIDKQIAIAQYEKAIQTAFREVSDNLVASQDYASEISEREASIKAQSRRLSLATNRYQEGEDSYLSVLSAQQDLYAAQRDLLQAHYNRLVSYMSLYQALGGG